MTKNPLEEIFQSHTGRIIHKWSNYLDIYHRHFQSFRGEKPLIMEIGVFRGGSLQMWKEYFGEGARIVGVDINPDCKKFEEDGIDIRIGDQEDPAFLESLLEEFGAPDILIDDGGHTMVQQIRTLEVMLEGMEDGGILLVEDTHSSYMPKFGGKLRGKGTFIEYCKKRIDDLHAWHAGKKVPVNRYTKTIRSLTFYDSVVVIEKDTVTPPEELKRPL